MKVGDLVKSKGHFRNQLGVVVKKCNHPTSKMAMLRVYWFGNPFFGKIGWFGAHKLEAVKKL